MQSALRSFSRLAQLPLFLERRLAFMFLIIVKNTRFVRRKHSGCAGVAILLVELTSRRCACV
jgi:hypothetical protein